VAFFVSLLLQKTKTSIPFVQNTDNNFCIVKTHTSNGLKSRQYKLYM